MICYISPTHLVAFSSLLFGMRKKWDFVFVEVAAQVEWILVVLQNVNVTVDLCLMRFELVRKGKLDISLDWNLEKVWS